MTSFKISSELLIGESSEIDAVFLPVNLDSYSETKPIDGVHCQDRSVVEKSDLPSNEFVQVSDGTSSKQEDESAGRAFMHALTTDTPDSDDWCYRASLTTICIMAVIVCCLLFGYNYIIATLEWLEQSDPLTSLSVLMLLFTIISFPIAWGLTLCMITSGYLYGLLYGPLVVTWCCSVSLTLSMLVMRNFCSNYLHSYFYSRKVEAIINVVSGSHGMKVIALTRLTPIPFGLQNALFSLSRISLFRYLISSVGGLVPMNILNCYIGSTLRNMHDLLSNGTNKWAGYGIFGGQLLVTALLLWFVVRKARVELKKAMDESEKTCQDLPNQDCFKTVYVDAS